jgi:hypothetical protein
MSINDEIDHFLFKSKMTTMAPLEKLSAHLSTNSIAAIIIGVLLALILIGVTTAYICKKYAEVSILFLSFHNNKSYFLLFFNRRVTVYTLLHLLASFKQYPTIRHG